MTTPGLNARHPLITKEEAQKFLLPGYAMDDYYPKQGTICGRQHLEYYFKVIWPLISAYRSVIVGQKAMTTYSLLGMFAVGDRDLDHISAGHVFLIADPGTGKTLLASVPKKVLRAKATRIQGTADLLPGDYTGGHILQIDPETERKYFEFIPGPAFGEIQLFDELSRTSPKMQSALLQVLCEGTITVAGKTYAVNPFMIMTGNELESEGTHKPADALMDRVMFQVRATPFSIDERIEIIRRTDKFRQIKLDQVADYAVVEEAREFFHEHVVISPEIQEFIARLSDTLNKADQLGLFEDLRAKFYFGDDEEILNPRAAILEGRGMLHLAGAAKAMAGVLRFRNYVTLADVQKVLLPVIRHRTRFMPGAIEEFREKMRKDLARRFSGKAGRTEMHEYLLGELARRAWAHVLLDMKGARHVGN